MTPEEVVRSLVEAVNSGNAGKVGEWMTPDHVLIDSDGTATNGREAMPDAWRALVNGEKVAVRQVYVNVERLLEIMERLEML